MKSKNKRAGYGRKHATAMNISPQIRSRIGAAADKVGVSVAHYITVVLYHHAQIAPFSPEDFSEYDKQLRIQELEAKLKELKEEE